MLRRVFVVEIKGGKRPGGVHVPQRRQAPGHGVTVRKRRSMEGTLGAKMQGGEEKRGRE